MKAEAAGFAAFAFLLTACVGGIAPPAGDDATTTGAAQAQNASRASDNPGLRDLNPDPQPLRPSGYLTRETTPDAAAIIAPAPKEGDPRNDADWAIFRATRALEGSERWALALSDDGYRPDALLATFSCAAGVELTVDNSPALAGVLARTTIDAGQAAAGAKEVYKRTRPFLHNPGAICLPRTDGLAASYDYPSGHASLGMVTGLVMASLAPDRATQLVARGRAYGESRVVCGVHNMSAVEAARTNAASVFAALQGSEDFVADMTRARAEMSAALATGEAPDAARCAKEAELVKPLGLE